MREFQVPVIAQKPWGFFQKADLRGKTGSNLPVPIKSAVLQQILDDPLPRRLHPIASKKSLTGLFSADHLKYHMHQFIGQSVFSTATSTLQRVGLFTLLLLARRRRPSPPRLNPHHLIWRQVRLPNRSPRRSRGSRRTTQLAISPHRPLHRQMGGIHPLRSSGGVLLRF